MPPESTMPRETPDMEQWICEARRGCPEALGRLLQTCRRYLLLVANQELAAAVRPKVAPSDLVQDTLLEAGRDFPRFRGATEEEFLGWLRRILRHNVANVHRHYEAEKRLVDREVPLADVVTGDRRAGGLRHMETPSRQAAERERDEQLERALHQLPEHYRQVLLLHSSEGLTFVQIAERLGGSADAVRKLWGRAAEELARLLESSR